jgi:deazaflavin-dependent oxidoreductase (nitroreductase family)
VLVIETIGRRSGKPRSTAVIYMRDGDRFLVTPANAGADRTPAWWLNLQASATATVVVDGGRLRVRARELRAAERDRLWRAFAARVAALDEYRAFTTRDIPLVALEPI